MVELRPMQLADIELLALWDADSDVREALGGRAIDWYDWPAELARDVPWQELLIATEDGRPVGFVQLTDAAEEESHHWGDVASGTWTIDIWIGAPEDRCRGLGARIMQLAIERNVDHGASAILIDPRVTNRRAIAFYQRLGFEAIGERSFGEDRCLVMRLDPSVGIIYR